jgi:Tol biopolymer transport system component
MSRSRSRRRRSSLLALLLAGCAGPATTGPDGPDDAAPTGEYLGQRAGDAPALFAPGFLSRRYGEMNATFSPDGAELYFTMKDAADRSSAILFTRRVDRRWQAPRIAPFSGRYDDVDPMFSPDGTRLYFSSYRPREPGATAPAADADIWYVERRGDLVGDPVHVDAPVSTPRDDFYPSLTRDGALYYSVWDGDRRTGDVFRARPAGGSYQVENVGAPINSESTEYDPFVAPDESYVIFVSSRPGGRGDGDLYVSFRDGERWSEAVNLGDAINTPAREYCPVMSPDGRYFFFTSKRTSDSSAGARAAPTAEQWTARYDAIENGLSNVYWLRSDFLGRLR